MGQKVSRRNSQRRRNHKLPHLRATLRVLGNIGLIVGQCVLLFVSKDIGLTIILLSSLLSFPYFLKEKMWDVLVLMAFMLVINLAGLLT